MAESVQYIHIDSNFGGAFWPVVTGASNQWNPRALGSGNEAKYKILIDASVTVNVMDLNRFGEGSDFTVSCNVQAGRDFGNQTPFALANNGKTAHFYAYGGVDNGKLDYKGIK